MRADFHYEWCTKIKVLLIMLLKEKLRHASLFKKDFVFIAPEGGPISAGGSKQLSVVNQWSQNVLDIKAAFTWPHMHSCAKTISHAGNNIYPQMTKQIHSAVQNSPYAGLCSDCLMKFMVLLNPYRFHNNIQYFVEWFCTSLHLACWI